MSIKLAAESESLVKSKDSETKELEDKPQGLPDDSLEDAQAEFIKTFKAFMQEFRHELHRDGEHSEKSDDNQSSSALLTSPLRSSAALFGHVSVPTEPVAPSSAIPSQEISKKATIKDPATTLFKKETPELILEDRHVKYQKTWDKRLLPSVHKPN